MPRSEQIPGEVHQVGERVQALILEVRDTPSSVKIILSRSHPELIRRLFEREVPEVGERTIEIKALAREPGHRTKIAVSSIDTKVDAVGACVGVRGSRIKNIVDELGGEKIDIVRWNESSQILISNALKPAEVAEVALCFELGRATVVVNEDQLSLAIGKRGQNVRLAHLLTGWKLDVRSEAEAEEEARSARASLNAIPGIGDINAELLYQWGFRSSEQLAEADETAFDVEGISAERAIQIINAAREHVANKKIAAEAKAAAAAEAAEIAAAEAALAATEAEGAEAASETIAVESAPAATEDAGEK